MFKCRIWNTEWLDKI